MKPAVLETGQRVFIAGIGGMGTAPLAILLSRMGCAVSGHDDNLQPAVRAHLEASGVAIEADLPPGCGLVCASSALPGEHPLLARARERGCRVMRRGELLAEVSRQTKLVAVCGSHGKTSTTALIIEALDAAGATFSYVLGGLFREEARAPARWTGSGTWLVAEIDESDGTIEAFSPCIAVALNFDWDHPAHYASPEALRGTFARLFGRTQQTVLLPAGCAQLAGAAAGSPARVVTYGEGGDYAAEVADRELVLSGGLGGRFRLPGGAPFNRTNALAALATVGLMGVEVPEAAFAHFAGVRRRQDVLAERSGLRVLADYAHHPTEVAAFLGHVRAESPGRLVVVFQPHRYTRTKLYAAEFAAALAASDEVMLLPVYGAGEPVDEAGMSGRIHDYFPPDREERVELFSGAEALRVALDALVAREPGPLTIAFVGAGDIADVADSFAADLSEEVSGGPQDALAARLAGKLSGESVFKENEPLAPKTTLRIGGPARYFAEPATEADLSLLLAAASAGGVRVAFLGRGSNLLVPDEGFPGLVVRLQHRNWRTIEPLGGGRLRVGGGARLKEISARACKAGFSGLEFLEGIPGTVGGALRMNAGAMGTWLFDVVESVRQVAYDGSAAELPRDAFHPAYRSCPELEEAVATSAVIRSEAGRQSGHIRSVVDTYAAKRRESQPREPSAGCTFKNPEGAHAGKLIDELGLKGHRVGGAEVSCVHANFIINRGSATAADVIALMREIRERAERECGHVLEPEVQLLGKSWEEVL